MKRKNTETIKIPSLYNTPHPHLQKKEKHKNRRRGKSNGKGYKIGEAISIDGLLQLPRADHQTSEFAGQPSDQQTTWSAQSKKKPGQSTAHQPTVNGINAKLG